MKCLWIMYLTERWICSFPLKEPFGLIKSNVIYPPTLLPEEVPAPLLKAAFQICCFVCGSAEDWVSPPSISATGNASFVSARHLLWSRVRRDSLSYLYLVSRRYWSPGLAEVEAWPSGNLGPADRYHGITWFRGKLFVEMSPASPTFLAIRAHKSLTGGQRSNFHTVPHSWYRGGVKRFGWVGGFLESAHKDAPSMLMFGR